MITLFAKQLVWFILSQISMDQYLIARSLYVAFNLRSN